MPYTDRVPKFVVDLDDEGVERWGDVIDADSEVVQDLADEVERDYESIPPFARAALRVSLATGYRLFGGRYVDEMKSWRGSLGRSLSDIILMNCSYEMSHLGWFAVNIYGCTAGVKYVPGLGMVHVRNMDWPLGSIGKATRTFEFVQGKRKFYSVGVAGYVGVLSGMLPYKYSVTLNWAPPNGRPQFAFGPSFLLREVLETCDTYADAVSVLKHTPLATSAFFTVCGVKQGQACVIERTQRSFYLPRCSPSQGGVLPFAQANHHFDGGALSHNNTDEELLEFSSERAVALYRALDKNKATTLEGVAECLDVEPVLNESSYQQMAFCPKTGEIKVWRWV